MLNCQWIQQFLIENDPRKGYQDQGHTPICKHTNSRHANNHPDAQCNTSTYFYWSIAFVDILACLGATQQGDDQMQFFVNCPLREGWLGVSRIRAPWMFKILSFWFPHELSFEWIHIGKIDHLLWVGLAHSRQHFWRIAFNVLDVVQSIWKMDLPHPTHSRGKLDGVWYR